MAEETVQTIEKVNARVRAIVERETADQPLWVGGEIGKAFESNFGHFYFTLYDGDYSIRCILRERRRGAIGFTPQNGMEVEVSGTVMVYEQWAQVQIEVEQMRLVETQKMTNFEPLEERLRRKGLWPREKRPLPPEIKRIGLVTSRHSEALTDFQNNYNSAGGTASIKAVDVRVQGEHAPRQIAEAIRRLNNEAEVDVIVLTRGGGRCSEMTVFDDPLIAEAICESKIPIVTGIGHERDEFFADRVADHAAGTPTAAANFLATSAQIRPRRMMIPLVLALALLGGGLLILIILAVLLQSW